jgi:hypothetical protein
LYFNDYKNTTKERHERDAPWMRVEMLEKGEERQETHRRGFDLPRGKTRVNNTRRGSSGGGEINRREESL